MYSCFIHSWYSTIQPCPTCNPTSIASASTQQPEPAQPIEQGKEEAKKRGKRITLCGSTKFKKEFDAINKQLTLEGNIVYSVCAFGHADNIKWTDEQKQLLDEVHKRKIDNSDAIFVIDVDGYIGNSTRSEIEHAERTGKIIKYLSDFPDLKMICDYATLSLDPTPTASRVEQAAKEYCDTTNGVTIYNHNSTRKAFIAGSSWQKQNAESVQEGWVDIGNMTNEKLLHVFKSVSLLDLSKCKFEFGEDEEGSWCNAIARGRVIDAIQFNGNTFSMMNNDGSFNLLNPMYDAYKALEQFHLSTPPSSPVK